MSSESKQQQDGTSDASITSRRLNDVTEAGNEAEIETDKQEEEEEVVEGITASSVLHESDNENGSKIKRSGGGDDIGSIATDNTNGVKSSKDNLETKKSNGGGVAIIEESSSSTSSVAVAVADDIDDDNKEQINKIKDKDIKEDINRNRDHDDIMDKNTDNNKKNDTKKDKISEDNNDIEDGNNMMIASGQKTKKGSTSYSIDDHPATDDDNFPSSSLLPSSLMSSSSGINSRNRTRSAATSSTIIRRSQSEVGAFAIDSPFSSSSNNNNNHNRDTTTITSAMTDSTSTGAGTGTGTNDTNSNNRNTNTEGGSSSGTNTNDYTMMTDGVYNASVTLVGSSTALATNTDTNLNYQHSSSGGSYGLSHHIVEAVRVDDDCFVVASIIENNSNNTSNNNNNNNENDEGKPATSDAAAAAAAAVAVKKQQFYVIGFVAVMILIVVTIILSVFLSGNNNSSNKINTATTTITSSTEVPTPTSINKIKRREKILEIIAPLSGDLFDPFNKQDHETDRIDAFNWLVDYDIITTDFDFTLQENERKIRQRYILALLYFSTNGQSWDEQYNFLSSNLDECDWTFVETDSDSDCEKDCEFGNKNGVTVQGVICNKQGRVERLRMWWTSMSGTLPPELSYFSDSLVELNLSGGSLTGAIPSSFEKLINLDSLMLNDHCLSGTIPSKLSQLPKLNMLTLGGNYELTGSLQEFCNETQYKEYKKQYFVVSANCDNNFCNTSSLVGDDKDYYKPNNVECECCICCNPDTFQCSTPLGDTWASYNKGDVSSSTGIPKSFDRPCLSEKSYDWLEDECPCFEDINNDTAIFQGYCTKNCTKVGTIPSYDPQAQQ